MVTLSVTAQCTTAASVLPLIIPNTNACYSKPSNNMYKLYTCMLKNMKHFRYILGGQSLNISAIIYLVTTIFLLQLNTDCLFKSDSLALKVFGHLSHPVIFPDESKFNLEGSNGKVFHQKVRRSQIKLTKGPTQRWLRLFFYSCVCELMFIDMTFII